jgi:hypothetical protein
MNKEADPAPCAVLGVRRYNSLEELLAALREFALYLYFYRQLIAAAASRDTITFLRNRLSSAVRR